MGLIAARNILMAIILLVHVPPIHRHKERVAHLVLQSSHVFVVSKNLALDDPLKSLPSTRISERSTAFIPVGIAARFYDRSIETIMAVMWWDRRPTTFTSWQGGREFDHRRRPAATPMLVERVIPTAAVVEHIA